MELSKFDKTIPYDPQIHSPELGRLVRQMMTVMLFDSPLIVGVPGGNAHLVLKRGEKSAHQVRMTTGYSFLVEITVGEKGANEVIVLGFGSDKQADQEPAQRLSLGKTIIQVVVPPIPEKDGYVAQGVTAFLNIWVNVFDAEVTFDPGKLPPQPEVLNKMAALIELLGHTGVEYKQEVYKLIDPNRVEDLEALTGLSVPGTPLPGTQEEIIEKYAGLWNNSDLLEDDEEED